MVRHERVAVDHNLPEVGVVVQEGEEMSAVVVAEEHLLSIIATLRNVQRIVGRRESEFAGHLTNKWFSRAIPLIYFAKKCRGPHEGVPFRNRRTIAATFL